MGSRLAALVQFFRGNGQSVPPRLALLLRLRERGTLGSPTLLPRAWAGGRALRLHGVCSSASGNAAKRLFPCSTRSAYIRAPQGHVATSAACSSHRWSWVHPR